MTTLFHRLSRPALCAFVLLLAGCATHPPSKLDIDSSITSVGQSSRVKQVVLHYTAVDEATSLKLLSQGEVSAHYLITDAPRPHVYNLVDENRNAWHAGVSSWYGQISLNATSIGIEQVNLGWTTEADGTRVWHPYTDEQINTLIVLLREIVDRHGIAPQNIVAHSDIAPQRKTDPGPLFPWKKLADAGLGRWYDEASAETNLARLQYEPLPEVLWFQQQLKRLGYESPQNGQLDQATINVLAAFQMHYRPALYDGLPDAQTAAIMLAMS